MHYIYLEAGSGADKPVPVEMVAAVKKAVGKNTKVICLAAEFVMGILQKNV